MKYTIKKKQSYNYYYDKDLYKLVKSFKQALACKNTLLKWLYKNFADIKIELYNIYEKKCYLVSRGHSSCGLPVKLEISEMVILQNGSSQLQLTKAVQKRAYRLVNSIVSL